MTIRIAVSVAAALCAVAPACSQPTTPAPTTTVTASSSTVAPAPPPSAAVPATTPPGADGSRGNDVSPEYCAQNEDPGCPEGAYIGPDAIPNPNGDGTYVPCEGTICTNPNYGGNTDVPDAGEVDQDVESP